MKTITKLRVAFELALSEKCTLEERLQKQIEVHELKLQCVYDEVVALKVLKGDAGDIHICILYIGVHVHIYNFFYFYRFPYSLSEKKNE